MEKLMNSKLNAFLKLMSFLLLLLVFSGITRGDDAELLAQIQNEMDHLNESGPNSNAENTTPEQEKRPERFRDFVEIQGGRSLYVDWRKAQPGKKTVVLLNGLTHSTEDWEPFADLLAHKGYGVFRFDPRGMGKTQISFPETQDPIMIEDQADDVELLLKKMRLEGPLDFIGLSYGGGLGIVVGTRHPELVRSLILMAPYTEPVKQQDNLIRAQIAATRLMLPFLNFTDEYLYGLYLSQQVVTTFPLAEPEILQHWLKPVGVYLLIQGIRKHDMTKDLNLLPPGSVYVVQAERDEYIQLGTLEEFWRKVPVQVRGAYVQMEEAKHKMPTELPHSSAKLCTVIIEGNLAGGGNWSMNPLTGVYRGL